MQILNENNRKYVHIFFGGIEIIGPHLLPCLNLAWSFKMETKCKYQAGELYHLEGMLLMNWGWWQFHLSVMKVYHYFIIDQQTCYKYESVWSKKKFVKSNFMKSFSRKKEFISLQKYMIYVWWNKHPSSINLLFWKSVICIIRP